MNVQKMDVKVFPAGHYVVGRGICPQSTVFKTWSPISKITETFLMLHRLFRSYFLQIFWPFEGMHTFTEALCPTWTWMCVRITVSCHGNPDTVSTDCFFKIAPKRSAQDVSLKLWYACKTCPQSQISQSGLSFHVLICYGGYCAKCPEHSEST